MTLEGTVTKGALVTDSGTRFPEGTRVRFEVIQDPDDFDELDRLPYSTESLPDDHPDAPYDREKELAILRESIAEMKADGGRPWREVLAELSGNHGLDTLPTE